MAGGSLTKLQLPTTSHISEDVLDQCLKVYSESELGALKERQFSELVLMVADALQDAPQGLSVSVMRKLKSLVQLN
jgi:hypothetical protein